MTVLEAKQNLINWCNSQVGYHESWDGSNKYGADGDWDLKLYGFDASAVAWCDVFVDYAFIHNFGYDLGTAMTFQVPSGYALCSASADAYRNNAHWSATPEVGAQIFFYYSGAINHTGIVVAVNGDQITCVEGNYADSVSRTYYDWKNSRQIAGYGIPDWKLVENGEETSNEPEQTEVVPSVRTCIHLSNGDGINAPLPQVKAWQNLLICWGYSLAPYGADGEFGTTTYNATMQFQQHLRDLGEDIEVNGIVDQDDWEQAIYLG